LKDEIGVRCVIANEPVYTYRKFLRDHTPGQSLPLSEEIGKRLFCLPIHPAMSDEDNEYMSAALIECIERMR